MTAVDIAAFDELVDGEARRFDVNGQPIAIVRIGDAVHAIGDTCSHATVSLSEGVVDTYDCTLECWKHGSAFSLLDGVPVSLPATQPVPVYEVTVDDGRVLIEVPAP